MIAISLSNAQFLNMRTEIYPAVTSITVVWLLSFFPFFFQLLLMAKKERKNHQGRVEARVERGKEENIQLKQKDVSAPVSINWQGFLVAVTDMT